MNQKAPSALLDIGFLDIGLRANSPKLRQADGLDPGSKIHKGDRVTAKRNLIIQHNAKFKVLWNGVIGGSKV